MSSAVRPGHREALIVACALLAGAAFLFWPLWTHQRHLVPFHVLAGDPTLEGLDGASDRPDWRTYDLAPVTVTYAEKALFARGLRQGESALWNPYSGLGLPLLADAQSQPLAPLFGPFLALPSPWVYSACLVLNLLFAGLGMDRFLKKLGVGLPGRLAGSLLTAFNPFTLKYLAYSNCWAYAWLPWLFLAAAAMREKAEAAWVLGALSALAGMSGHPEEALMGSAAAFAFGVIGRCQAGGLGGGRWAQSLVAPLAALFLSAWWLLPFFEWAAHSQSVRLHGFRPVSYGWSSPFLWGSELLWLPLLVGLAAAGILCRRKLALAFAPALAASLLMVFPVSKWVQMALSLGFMSNRYGRSLAWFALVALGSVGLDAWRRGELTRRARGWVPAVQAVWLAAAGLVAFLGAAPEGARPDRVPLSGVPAASVPAYWILAVAGLALCLLPLRPGDPGRGRLNWALAAAFAACGLLMPPGTWAHWNSSEPSPRTDIRPAGPGGRIWLPSPGGFQYLSPNLSAAFGLRDVRYVSPLTPKRLAPLAGDLGLGFQGFLRLDPAQAAFAGVDTAWTLSQTGSLVRNVSRRPPASRGFWVGRAETAGSPREALERSLSREAWTQVAFLEPRAAEPVRSDPETGGLSLVEGVPVFDRCNRTVWTVDAPAAGWFVLRDLYWPGWKAEVDGAGEPILACDGVFRAVRVGPGRHTVDFRYRPSSVGAGVLISLATLVALWVWRWRSKRP